MTGLVRIVAPHFVAGVVVGERAAPIVKYMRKWDVGRISAYCASKGWVLEETRIDDPQLNLL